MTVLSEHDLDGFREAIREAAREHADRAVAALVADLELYLARYDAHDEDNPTRKWAACLLITALELKAKT